MKSLKRLFTSILPTSWVDEDQDKNKRKKINSSFYDNEESMDIMDDNSGGLTQ